MEYWEKAITLERFIRHYIPKGYREPIHKFDFVPYITEDNYRLFKTAYKNGKLTEVLTTHSDLEFNEVKIYRFNRPYIISAIQDYFEQGE